MSEQEYVGIDLHRRRSVIVRVSSKGEPLSTTRVANDPVAIMEAVADAGSKPEMVLEATYGWYWLVDLLQAEGASVHLASPSGLNWGYRRVKNDERDALDLVRKLRLGELPAVGALVGSLVTGALVGGVVIGAAAGGVVTGAVVGSVVGGVVIGAVAGDLAIAGLLSELVNGPAISTPLRAKTARTARAPASSGVLPAEWGLI